MVVFRPSSTSWSIPARVGPTEVEPSYQRNRLQTSRNQLGWTSQLADGAFQINSSTFGTLLSSQGSSAHRSPASRPRWGATWSNLPGRSRPVKLAPVPVVLRLAPLSATRSEPAVVRSRRRIESAQADHDRAAGRLALGRSTRDAAAPQHLVEGDLGCRLRRREVRGLHLAVMSRGVAA